MTYTAAGVLLGLPNDTRLFVFAVRGMAAAFSFCGNVPVSGTIILKNTASGMPSRKRPFLAAGSILLAGICAGHGKPVTFRCFLHYGLPIVVPPLAVSALYALALFFLMR